MRQQIGSNQTELARLCGVSPQTISRHVDRGVIPGGEIQLGRRRLFATAQVEAIARYFEERARGETLGKYSYDESGRMPESRVGSQQKIIQTKKEEENEMR